MSDKYWEESEEERLCTENIETPEEKLVEKVKKLEQVVNFLLDEVIATHKEAKRGSCSPDCPKCNFYKNMRD